MVVDNGSVYTSNLIQFLKKKEVKFHFQKFDEIDLNDLEKYNSFILSGRKRNDKKMNSINSAIIKHSISNDKNLLGICYGAEILALTLGGTIKRMKSLIKGIQKITIVKENALCIGTIDAYESHHYEISRINDSFTQIAKSNLCNFEIIQQKNQNIFGVQFHPEMSEDGRKILEKFVKL